MIDVPRKILIIDDDDGIRRQLRWAFDGFEVAMAGDRKGAIEGIAVEKPPVVLLDLGLPPDADGPSEGLAALEGILAAAPGTKVIVMTGQAERDHAVRAVALGAYDFYQKPIEMEVLGPIVDRAHGLFALEEENRRLSSAVAGTPLPGLVTANPRMRAICDEIRKFAPIDMSALIVGESGTGKELLARAIHGLSGRKPDRFVAINCAAIPEPLLESELFGHEKGAFTGADKTTVGKAELADGGTLFLDEVGDMSLALQSKLLRFLQERVIERVGGRKNIAVDARVVSATNRDLSAAIRDGDFREDLYYRLTGFVVEIPPLRERPDDALVIANHLLAEYAGEQGKAMRGFAPDALAAISGHAWPGNVRELQNRIQRAVVMAKGRRVVAADLELDTPEEAEAEARAGALSLVTLKQARESAELAAIKAAMIQVDGTVAKAAKILDVSRPKMYDLLRSYRLKK